MFSRRDFYEQCYSLVGLDFTEIAKKSLTNGATSAPNIVGQARLTVAQRSIPNGLNQSHSDKHHIQVFYLFITTKFLRDYIYV